MKSQLKNTNLKGYFVLKKFEKLIFKISSIQKKIFVYITLLMFNPPNYFSRTAESSHNYEDVENNQTQGSYMQG